MTEEHAPAIDDDRTPAELAHMSELRAAIATSLTHTPVDSQALRARVWTYVGVERHAGTSPGHVMIALTGLIDAANIARSPRRQALTRRVILWGVEAYFGHLDGDVVGRDGDALSDIPSASTGSMLSDTSAVATTLPATTSTTLGHPTSALQELTAASTFAAMNLASITAEEIGPSAPRDLIATPSQIAIAPPVR